MYPIAKTDGTGATRSLLGHCLDVALAAQFILSSPILKERVSRVAGVEISDVHIARLAVLAGHSEEPLLLLLPILAAS